LSEFVRLRNEEWDAFVSDNELLIERYEDLLGNMKELRNERAVLLTSYGYSRETASRRSARSKHPRQTKQNFHAQY